MLALVVLAKINTEKMLTCTVGQMTVNSLIHVLINVNNKYIYVTSSTYLLWKSSKRFISAH